MNTNINNCNTELLEQQKQQLEYEIVYGENEGHFAVFDIEAGCRKTRTAEQALVSLYKTGKKAIFVRLFNDDCRESANIINNSIGKEIAFAYNNEDVKPEMAKRLDLESIPILIITHQKYKVLMMDVNKRKAFTKGRTTLVIDEFLSAIHTISLSESDIETYRVLFDHDTILLQTFEKAVNKLSDYLTVWNKNDGIRKFASIADSTPTKFFNELKKLIRANMTNEILETRKCEIEKNKSEHENINLSLLSELKTVKILCDRLMEYKQLFGHMFLYCNKKMFTTDKRYKYWYLDNNIMLDASGELQNVAIIQTHNLSDVDYILKFLHYSREQLNEKFNLSARSHGRWEQTTYSFNDSRLEDIRVYWIASEIYQAIKRVNRNMLYATDVIIFLNNEKIISLIQEQMKNCSLEVVEYQKDTFQVEKSKQDEYFTKLKQDSYATKFIELLAGIQSGLHKEFVDEQNRISKIKVREHLGINSSSNFADKVLRQSEVIFYCQVRNIDLNGRYIRLPQAS